mmetsp:Transcript_74285/g.227263  ORF Transcript_74285/g.227263 Transcript_74285/m.227263 type:complete len:249 (-) Transcript_74285:710-1456(-)
MPALQLITGIGVNISFGRESSRELVTGSHRAPSSHMPEQNAPSFDAASTFFASFFVTSVKTCSLSSSRPWFWQQSCLIAVRKLCGLNNFEMSTTFGMFNGSLIQSSSCTHRSCKFTRQDFKGRVEAKPSFTHHIGNFSAKRQFARSSMTSLMVNSPLKPNCNSCNPRTISYTKPFMYSHSCKKTNWYGPFSSSDIARLTSSVANFFSWTSSRISPHVCSAMAMGLWVSASSPPPPAPPPVSVISMSKV